MNIAETRFEVGDVAIKVSTINRQCSAIECPSLYAETIVFDITDPKHWKILDQDESSADSLDGHDRMVSKWFQTS